MTEATAPVHPAVEDLLDILHRALTRGAELLTGGELAVVRQIQQLPVDAALVYARISGRKRSLFRVAQLEADHEVELLCEGGLLHGVTTWSIRAEALTIPELAAYCRELGLSPRGKKADLVERLSPFPRMPRERWVVHPHRRLIRRLERWASLRLHPDRSAAVIERMGHLRWPSYPLTPGGIHPDRRTLLDWEDLATRLPSLDAPSALAELEQARVWPRGGLDLRWRLQARVRELARDHERAGDATLARSLYRRLEAHTQPARLAVRIARTLEADGRQADALQHLNAARSDAAPVERLAISRTGRRIARSIRRGWAPDPPLAQPASRDLRLPGAPERFRRPAYYVGGRHLTVEHAVVEMLSGYGRTALFAEGPLWTTLYALIFVEAYFLAIPGALPVPRLSGPLDLGRPEFFTRRASIIKPILARIAEGKAAEMVATAHSQWAGIRLSGASWDLATGEQLAEIAGSLPPTVLLGILGRLLEEGWRATAGLPDLVVLPGAETRMAEALPAKLSEGIHLVEIKGPKDTVRDEQAIWFDTLQRHGAPIALWSVHPE